MLKAKFYLRNTRKNSEGESALYVQINTSPLTWLTSGIFLKENIWDQKKQKVLKCHDKSKIDALMSSIKAKCDFYLNKIQTENLLFDKNHLLKYIRSNDTDEASNPKLIAFIEEYLRANKISIGRMRHYRVVLNDIQDFRPDIRIKQIDYHFGKLFEKYLRIQKGNQINTIATKLKMLKALIHFAQELKYIKDDPLKSLKISSKRSRRTALEQWELLQLQKLYDEDDQMSGSEKVTLCNFLFSCYTGLRFGDIKSLKRSDIKNGILYIDMNKTGAPVSIPLIPQAAKLLPQSKSGNCFQVFTNEASNRHLKTIARIAQIDKLLTFHVSRHTFATISLKLGIGIKIVSEILGHSSVKITEQYLHIIDDMKADELRKWQQLSA